VRRRIVGLTVLAAMLATALFAIPLAVAAARSLVAEEHNELEHTADAVAIAVSGDLTRTQNSTRPPATEHDVEVTVYAANGNKISGPGPVALGRLAIRAVHGAVASGELSGRYALAVPVSDGDTVAGVVLVTASHAQVYRRIAEAWLAMIGLAAAAVAVAWLLGRRQARRLTRPLEALDAAAERLGAGDFSVRTRPSGIDEIDSVNTSLNSTAARLGNLVERERAFAADASHQLRTPLTGLRLGIEAALADPASDPRAALHDALVSADRLQATVTDLLTLARDTRRSPELLDAAALFDDLRQRWHGTLAVDGRPLRILLQPMIPATRMSQPCARQILDVLVDNARRHGTGAVTVTARDAGEALAIDVTDGGPAIERDPNQLFERRSPHATGTGIGLAFARSLAEAEGARLSLSSRHPPTFTLLVPTHRAGRDPEPYPAAGHSGFDDLSNGVNRRP
jgi:signal transduction histidine kinase